MQCKAHINLDQTGQVQKQIRLTPWMVVGGGVVCLVGQVVWIRFGRGIRKVNRIAWIAAGHAWIPFWPEPFACDRPQFALTSAPKRTKKKKNIPTYSRFSTVFISVLALWKFFACISIYVPRIKFSAPSKCWPRRPRRAETGHNGT